MGLEGGVEMGIDVWRAGVVGVGVGVGACLADRPHLAGQLHAMDLQVGPAVGPAPPQGLAVLAVGQGPAVGQIPAVGRIITMSHK